MSDKPTNFAELEEALDRIPAMERGAGGMLLIQVTKVLSREVKNLRAQIAILQAELSEPESEGHP